MIIDFKNIDCAEKPVLILRNLDGTAIQTLGYAFDVSVELYYNEISTLKFSLPSYVNGVYTPHYDDVVGMRIIDLKGYGQFILVDPETESDGITIVKSCTAYSLEYEFTKKKMVLTNSQCTTDSSQYNFWNPINPEGTVLQQIIECVPGWSVGSIDDMLIGKYRTFEETDDNVYNFIKSSVQETYGCIFDFDTYSRTINVVSTALKYNTDGEEIAVTPQPVYLSAERLIKKINIEEDSDSIVTCLDVNGAEGVTIRSVNPTGTNKIYNLDYFMNETNFSESMINKWNEWEQACENQQLNYFNITTEYNLQIARQAAEQAALSTLQGELTSLENVLAARIEAIEEDAIAEGYTKKTWLAEINSDISDKEAEITAQNELIQSIETTAQTLFAKLGDINASLKMSNYFNEDELAILQRYFIEDSIQDETFVAPTAQTYSNDDVSSSVINKTFTVSNSDITKSYSGEDKTMYTVDGGSLSISSVSANIIRATVEFNSDNTFILTAYMDKGMVGEASFTSGNITLTGEYTSLSVKSASASFTITDGTLYFTKNTTDYEQHVIEWDLYEYGRQVLAEKSVPTYSFKVDSGNFLHHKDFISFKNNFELGKKIYLKIDKSEPLKPYVIAVKFNFEDPTDFELEFGNTYTSADRSFALAKLLEDSVSMGKKLSSSNGIYSEFVYSGASTKVRDFMNSALDIAKNTVMSSGEQAIEFGDAGIRVRKWADEAHTTYDPEQIWIVDNMIAFTDDNWNSAKIGIGKFKDKNFPEALYGIVAPYIVGTILAGENLMIDTENGSFKVDASGVYIDSLKFVINHTGTEGTETSNPLSGLLSENGYLNTHSMEGSIEAAKNQMMAMLTQMESGGGNVLFDEEGIWLMNAPAKTTCTKAVLMNDVGIAFGKGNALNTIGKSDKSPFKDRAEVEWDWGTTIGYDGVFTNGTVSGSRLIGNTIEGGSLDIGDGNFTVDEDGNLTANSGVFKGTVQGATFKTAKGSNMMNSEYQFLPDYLTLLGMEIVSETTGNTTFKVDNNGNVTVKGNITLGSGSSIQWEYIDETDSDAYNTAETAKTNIRKLANGTYTGGTFIDGTTVSSPTIRGGYVVGGKFFAVDDVNATITNSDITGCVRMIIDSNGISSYNKQDELSGISLTADSGFGKLMFYYQGDERGSLYQSGGTMYLSSTQRLIIGRGGGDVWFDEGDVIFKNNINVDFTNANVTGITAKFG